MAKRFTDTEKWKKAWFRELGSKWRDIWFYLCDQCDHAGIWEVDLETLAHFTGHKITLNELLERFQGKIVYLTDAKVFMKTFFDFQYGDSKKAFKARQSALKILGEYGLVDSELLGNCPEQLGDTSGQFPNCPSNSNSKGTSNSNSNSSEVVVSHSDAAKLESRMKFDLQGLFEPYPRQQWKTKALAILADKVRSLEDRVQWERAIKNYAAFCKAENPELKYTLTFESFANDWQYWRDYKPAAGSAGESREQRTERMAREMAEHKARMAQVYGEGA